MDSSSTCYVELVALVGSIVTTNDVLCSLVCVTLRLAISDEYLGIGLSNVGDTVTHRLMQVTV